MELQKRGFTLFEIIISFTIIMVVMVAALPILFKKNKVTTEVSRPMGEWVCNHARSDIGVCNFRIEDPERNEFVTIQLVGGGGGGCTHKGGSSGEGKVIYLPSMPGTYNIELGKGGGVCQNGGRTTIYRTDVNPRKIIDYADGGKTTNEEILSDDTSVIAEEEAGKQSPFSESGGGKGGDKDQAGAMGEVIIRW